VTLGTRPQKAAPAILTGRPFSVDQIIQFQTEFKRTHAYQPLGRIMTIIFERLEGEACPPPGTDVWGRSLDYDGNRSGPMLALSGDHMHLLCIGQFPMQLPDVPDPQDNARRIPQRYRDRSDKHLDGTNLIVFEPVYQLLADPLGVEAPGSGIARPPLIAQFRADTFGHHPALLIDAQNGDGWIVGGAFELLS
jgi:hypothetical protein